MGEGAQIMHAGTHKTKKSARVTSLNWLWLREVHLQVLAMYCSIFRNYHVFVLLFDLVCEEQTC